MTKIKGYKATLWSGMPKYGRRRTPYNVGGNYSTKADLVVCLSGLHFCRRMCFVYDTYDSAFYTRVFAVEARGKLRFDEDKLCTDRLKIVRELTPEEMLLQLANDANHRDTASFACNRAVHILYSITMRERETEDLYNNIAAAWSECRDMPALRYASCRLQWAQAFLDYRELPICRVAMHSCGITELKLMRLVETLRQDPILNTNDNEEKTNERTS